MQPNNSRKKELPALVNKINCKASECQANDAEIRTALRPIRKLIFENVEFEGSDILKLFYYNAELDIVAWNTFHDEDPEFFEAVRSLQAKIQQNPSEFLKNAHFLPMLVYAMHEPSAAIKAGFRPFRKDVHSEGYAEDKDEIIAELVRMITLIAKLETPEDQTIFLRSPYVHATADMAFCFKLVRNNVGTYIKCESLDAEHTIPSRCFAANSRVYNLESSWFTDTSIEMTKHFKYIQDKFKAQQDQTTEDLDTFCAAFLQPGKMYTIDGKDHIIDQILEDDAGGSLNVKYNILKSTVQGDSLLRNFESAPGEGMEIQTEPPDIVSIQKFMLMVLSAAFSVESPSKNTGIILSHVMTYIGNYTGLYGLCISMDTTSREISAVFQEKKWFDGDKTNMFYVFSNLAMESFMKFLTERPRQNPNNDVTTTAYLDFGDGTYMKLGERNSEKMDPGPFKQFTPVKIENVSVVNSEANITGTSGAMPVGEQQYLTGPCAMYEPMPRHPSSMAYCGNCGPCRTLATRMAYAWPSPATQCTYARNGAPTCDRGYAFCQPPPMSYGFTPHNPNAYMQCAPLPRNPNAYMQCAPPPHNPNAYMQCAPPQQMPRNVYVGV